jgi:hypothetical protein
MIVSHRYSRKTLIADCIQVFIDLLFFDENPTDDSLDVDFFLVIVMMNLDLKPISLGGTSVFHMVGH